MDIVVTKNDVVYSSNFLKVSSLQEASQIVGIIDFLVYNNSDEKSEDRIKYLNDLKGRAKKLVYICSERKTDLAVKMIVNSSGGRYFDDEFFLESSTELNNLLNSLDEFTALAELGGTNVLTDFFNRYLKNGDSDFNSNYLMVVKDAVSTLLDEYNQKNVEILQMSETASEIFSNMSSLLSKMKEERVNLQEIAEKMANKTKEQTSSSKRMGSVLFYPRISYMNERSIIRIKEIGDFRFLISFMIGFRSYLENVKNLRPKLIVFESVGEVIEKRYSEFKWVKLDNAKKTDNYDSNIVFTNCPSKEVIDKLLSDSNYDTFIVVDRTVSDKDHILNSKGSPVKYAISGKSCIDKFNLSKQRCMTSIVDMPGNLLTVPLYPDYPVDKAARERFYMSKFSSEYEKLLSDLRRR